MEIAPGTLVDGRYAVHGVLGRGAMAVVYVVRHEQLGTLHAMKVLQLPTWSIQARFKREGRIQGSLRHPNVVAVTDMVDVGGVPGLVMELVRGPNMERLLAHVQLPADAVLALGTGVLLGARAAQHEGLIHRDLKPANVLIETSGTTLVPKITDFGLAKLLQPEDASSGATRTGTSMGTPAYMAPEQIRDASSVDVRADVFGLGALLYELATGHRAFPGEDLLDLFQRIAAGEYVPPREHVPDLPDGIVRALEGALVPDREERTPTVDALLDAWTEGEGEAAAQMTPDRGLMAQARSLVGADPTRTLAPSVGATFEMSGTPVAMTPAPAPGAASSTPPPAEMGRSRAAVGRRPAWVWGLAALGAVCVVGALFLAVVGMGIAAGTLALGDRAPPSVERLVERTAYTGEGVPTVSGFDAAQAVEHELAWQALLDGRPDDAVVHLEPLVSAVPQAVGPRVLLGTALLWTGSPRALDLLEAADAREGRGARSDLARLATQAMLEGPDRADIRKHLDRRTDDLLARLLLPSLDGWDPEPRLAAGEEAVALAPDRVGPLWRHAVLLLDRGRVDEAEDALAKALALDPAHLRSRLLSARIRLHHGDAQTAMVVCEQLLAAQPHLVEAWEVRATAARLMASGPEGLAGIEAIAFGGEVPPGVSSAFALGASRGAIGLGRVTEAGEWVDRGLDAAEVEGDIVALLELVRLELLTARYVGRRSDLVRALDRARGVASLPELQAGGRARLALRVVLLEGLLALEDGDESVVALTVTRLEGLDRGDRLAGMLRAAAMARRGAVPDAEGPTRSGSTCPGRSFRARWLAEAGVPASEDVYRDVVGEGSPCGLGGPDRFARAHARAHLAQLAYAAGDPETARRHLESFERLMPDPELGLPIYDRVLTVREAMDWDAQ